MAVDDVNVKLSLTDDLSGGLDKASEATEAFGKATSKSFAEAEKASKTFAKVLAGIGAAVGAGLGLAIGEFAGFEKGMSRVKAITGATGKEFDDLTDLAKTMGRTTAFTATEASEAMNFLGMAGFEANEIMEALPATLDLAAAASIELGRAADIVSNVMQQFGADTSETSHFVDVLAATTTSSNTTMEELSDAMNFLAPTMASLSGEVEEAAATIGILANAGLKGSNATAVLKTSLLRLSKPTSDMEEGMARAGFVAFDAQENFVGLTDVIRQMEEGTANMTEKMRSQTISQIFGVRAYSQINVLIQAGSEELARYTKILENSDGAARKMAKTMLDNLAGSWTIFTSAVSGLKIELGSRFAPVLREVLGIMSDWFLMITENLPTAEAFTQWLEDNQVLLASVAGAITAMLIPALKFLAVALWGVVAPLLPFAVAGGVVVGLIVLLRNTFIKLEKFLVDNFSIAVAGIISGFFTVSAMITTLVTALGVLQVLFKVQALTWTLATIKSVAYGVAMGFATAATWAFNAALLVLTSPITWVIVAIGLLVAAVIWLWNNWELAGEKLKEAMKAIADFFDGAFDRMKKSLKSSWQNMNSDTKAALRTMLFFITGGLSEVVIFIIKNWDEIKKVTSETWVKVQEFFSDGIKWIVEFLKNSRDWINEAFTSMLDGIVGVAKSVFNTVMGVIQSFINGVVRSINFLIRAANAVSPFGDIPEVQQVSLELFSKGGIAGIGKAATMAASQFSSTFAKATKFATGGIVGGVGNSDTQPALLTPGEMILTGEQQRNLFNLAKGDSRGGGLTVIVENNNFYGDDESFADKVGNTIIETFRQHYQFEHFSFK
ncbi:MAG: phage tail tape measure protein [Calditrichia bacterium]